MEKKEVIRNALYKLLGFVIYLAILGLLNILTLFSSAGSFLEVIKFLNNNIFIAFLITLVFFLASLFNSMKYPYNLPAPVFVSIGITIISWMLLEILNVVKSELNSRVISFLVAHSVNVYILIAAFVLIIEYIELNKKKS